LILIRFSSVTKQQNHARIVGIAGALAGRIAVVEHTPAEALGLVEEEILVKDIPVAVGGFPVAEVDIPAADEVDIPAAAVHAAEYIPVVLAHIRSNHRIQGPGCNC
jgi:hypothetical protein